MIIAVGGLTIVAVIPYATISHAKTLGQMLRLIALGLFAVSAIGTEMQHFGDWAHYRLFFNVAGVVVAAIGLWMMFKMERPAQSRISTSGRVRQAEREDREEQVEIREDRQDQRDQITRRSAQHRREQ
jgi:hypothetical protein